MVYYKEALRVGMEEVLFEQSRNGDKNQEKREEVGQGKKHEEEWSMVKRKKVGERKRKKRNQRERG